MHINCRAFFGISYPMIVLQPLHQSWKESMLNKEAPTFPLPYFPHISYLLQVLIRHHCNVLLTCHGINILENSHKCYICSAKQIFNSHLICRSVQMFEFSLSNVASLPNEQPLWKMLQVLKYYIWNWLLRAQKSRSTEYDSSPSL